MSVIQKRLNFDLSKQLFLLFLFLYLLLQQLLYDAKKSSFLLSGHKHIPKGSLPHLVKQFKIIKSKLFRSTILRSGRFLSFLDIPKKLYIFFLKLKMLLFLRDLFLYGMYLYFDFGRVYLI